MKQGLFKKDSMTVACESHLKGRNKTRERTDTHFTPRGKFRGVVMFVVEGSAGLSRNEVHGWLQ